MKNDTSLFSLRNIKILTNMQKIFFEILVQTALTVGLFWTILKLTPKSTLLSFTILYYDVMKYLMKPWNYLAFLDLFLGHNNYIDLTPLCCWSPSFLHSPSKCNVSVVRSLTPVVLFPNSNVDSYVNLSV